MSSNEFKNMTCKHFYVTNTKTELELTNPKIYNINPIVNFDQISDSLYSNDPNKLYLSGVVDQTDFYDFIKLPTLVKKQFENNNFSLESEHLIDTKQFLNTKKILQYVLRHKQKFGINQNADGLISACNISIFNRRKFDINKDGPLDIGIINNEISTNNLKTTTIYWVSGIVSSQTGGITYNKPAKNDKSDITTFKLQYNGNDYNFDDVKTGLLSLFDKLKNNNVTSGLIIANEQTQREGDQEIDPNAEQESIYTPEILEKLSGVLSSANALENYTAKSFQTLYDSCEAVLRRIL